MYYDDLVETAVNDESSLEFRLRQKKSEDFFKKLDKNYETYTIPFNDNWIDGKYYKSITINNYGSGSNRTRVRNAVTGAYYNVMVGSTDEDLFFKVIDSMGRFRRKEPLILYYDSPEQYENHHFVSVSNKVKAKWYKRSLEVQKRLNML